MASNQIQLEVIADIKKALNSLRSLETDGKKAVSGLSSSFNALKLAAGGIAGAIGGIAIGKIVGDLGDFSKAVAEVRTIAPDVIKNNKNLAKSFIELGAEFGTDAGKQAKLLYQIISAGITDATKSQETLIASNKLAIGGLADTSESVNILTTALNVYKDENLSAEKAADILFTTVKLGKTNISELAGSIGNVLPVAKSMGITFEEVNAAVADLTAKGIPTTAQAVTTLKAVFSGIINTQKNLSKETKAVREAFSLASLKTKDLTTFLRDANDAVGGSAVKLTQLLGSSEALSAFLTLASDNFVGLKNSIDEMTKSTGAADAAYQGIANTLGFQLDQLKANFGNLILRFSTEGEGDLTNTIKLINQSLVYMVKNFDDVVKQIQRVVLDIGIMAFVFKGIPLIIKQIQISMTSLNASINSSVFYVKVFGKIFAATRYQAIALNLTIKALKASLSFGVLLIVDFIIEKVLELNEEFGGFINTAKAGASQIKIYFLEAINALLPSINLVAKAFGKGFNVEAVIEKNNKAIKESTQYISDLKKTASDSKQFTKGVRDLQEELDKVNAGAKGTKDQIEDTFDPKPAEDFLKTVKDANEKLAQDIKKVGKDSIEIIKIDTEYQIAKIKTQIASLDLTKNINKETKKGLEEQIRLLNKLAGAQISEIKKKDKPEKTDNRTSIISDFFSKLFSDTKDFITPFTDDFGSGLEKQFDSVFGESAFKNISAGFTTAFNIVSEIYDGAAAVFSGIYDVSAFVYNTVSTAADAFVNTISAGFNAIFGAGLLNNINAIFTQFANIPDNFIKAFEELPKITEGLADKLKEAIPKILAGLPDFFKTAISAFQEIIPVILEAVPDVIKALASGIVDLADELFNNFIPQLIDALPGIVDAILEKLPDLISTILKSIPKIVSSLVKALPKIVKSLADALPGIIEVFADNMAPIVESLVDGLIVGSADIIVALVDSFITRGGSLRIGIAVARAMLIELPIGIAKGVLSGLKNLGGDTFKKLGADLSSGIVLPEIPTPGWLGEINKALNNSGFTKSLQAIVDLLSGISKSIEKTLGQGGGGVVGALKSGDIGGAVTQVLGGPGKVLGFAEGGMVPSGFPNDTFPARLTSGELVIDRSTVDKLNRFIDQGGGSSQPIQINLKVGEADLAKVMYKLNKQGYRVA